MFKKTTLALSLFCVISTTSAAEWSVGAGFSNFSDKIGSESFNLGVAYASASYEYKLKDMNLSIVPEFHYGIGIADERIENVKLEADYFASLSIKALYNINDNFYVYAAPSYGKLKITATYEGNSASASSDWELAYGAGFGYKLNDKFSVELSYDDYDGTDVVSIGFKTTY